MCIVFAVVVHPVDVVVNLPFVHGLENPSSDGWLAGVHVAEKPFLGMWPQQASLLCMYITAFT